VTTGVSRSEAAAVVEAAEPHLEFERVGEVRLKGFGDATELFVAGAADDDG
jgi:adenylate cyclase